MMKIIQLDHVSKTFSVGRAILSSTQRIQVIDKISFLMEKGEVLCLAGESGCGKTTTGKLIAGLLRPTDGRVLFHGKDIWEMSRNEFKTYRKNVQIIHQDPYASLNPNYQTYKTLSTPLFRHRLVRNRKEAIDEITRLLEAVDLTPPEDFIYKYPHQLSGGQRQRIVIARAFTLKPQFIVADEAVSMLDTSIKLGVLDIFSRLKKELGLAILFITHDLAIARYFGWKGRIAIMYLGRLVEIGPTPEVVKEPLHPYTKALLQAIPEPDPKLTRKKKMMELRSLDIPSLLDLPSGCKFHPRCPFFEQNRCDIEEPELIKVGDGRYVACHLIKGVKR